MDLDMIWIEQLIKNKLSKEVPALVKLSEAELLPVLKVLADSNFRNKLDRYI